MTKGLRVHASGISGLDLSPTKILRSRAALRDFQRLGLGLGSKGRNFGSAGFGSAGFGSAGAL